MGVVESLQFFDMAVKGNVIKLKKKKKMQGWLRQKWRSIMNKTQKNKKKLIKPFKKMIYEQGENSLVYIPKSNIVELETKDIIKEIKGYDNTWYQINIDMNEGIDMIEMVPDYYKIVGGGETGQFLRHYKWKYDGKNVYCNTIITGRNVRIERVILNYEKYGYFNNININEAAHHMWFRFCAIGDMLKSIPQDVHLECHHMIGNYDRGQSLKIESVPDFQYFISRIVQFRTVLKNKKFSIEF